MDKYQTKKGWGILPHPLEVHSKSLISVGSTNERFGALRCKRLARASKTPGKQESADDVR